MNWLNRSNIFLWFFANFISIFLLRIFEDFFDDFNYNFLTDFFFLFQKGQDVKEKPELDSDDSEELQTEEKDKERHSSGESIDSAVCFSTPTSPIKSESPHRFLVIPSDLGKQDSNVKGILRRTRGYSETNVDFLRMASPAESETSTIGNLQLHVNFVH